MTQTAAITYTEVEQIGPTARFSTAPNGSSSGTSYHTLVKVRQDWADTPENGIYAGKSYLIHNYYISPSPEHPRSQFLGSDSRPWTD